MITAVCAPAFVEEEIFDEGCLAIAYTGENYQGVSWRIYEAGEYDLHWKIEEGTPRKVFGLPNDSLCSLRVRPGHRVTLYEHAELLGDSRVEKGDLPSLGRMWNRQASSLTLSRNVTDEERRWLASISYDGGDFTTAARELDDEAIIEVLQARAEFFTWLRTSGETGWYGRRSDGERVDMGDHLLALFEALGYDVSSWTASSFAQEMNNYYDWRKDLSIWDMACLVLSVDGARYELLYDGR